ncbi:hypothetical protein [Saccharopolyspora phatthalungensis]|uniref:Uncharacterized protein n=1 Tax=Saccharopolyspora phatthalungensis TaxID=664693 RepID=A0A840QJU5_9PSEU|nr:hypothetical protein [Saccharopolyspora phatthalungensis]MBB5159345.1 hypothetical protein [Saccharopolyspora phatthalungensis]
MIIGRRTDADTQVVPVGHYMGPFYPGLGAELQHHIIRVGWDSVRMTQQEFETWALCHGPAGLVRGQRWTKRHLVDSGATKLGQRAVRKSLGRLIERGAVVELGQGPNGAETFARAYRFQSLLFGLGNPVGDPFVFGVGLPGRPPVLTLSAEDFQLWQWGHISDTLWNCCELSAESWRKAGSTDPDRTDVRRNLARSVATLQVLVAHGAAYVDLPRRQTRQG